MIDLLSFPVRVKDAVFHSYSWGYDGEGQQFGTKITRFRKDPIEYEATIIIRGSVDSRKDTLDQFLESTEYDIINKSPGKLIIGDYYINAYMTSSSTAPYEGADWTQKDVVFLCPYPFWIKEESKSFPPVSNTGSQETFLDYEYDYDYDFTLPPIGNTIWSVDHYAPCEFLMTVFGQCVDPRILINGSPYQVYTTLAPGEYMQIDSRKNSITKILTNGTRQSLYDLRPKYPNPSVFSPITPGNIAIQWPGSFGFDLTLYLERSEPKWKTQDN